MREYNKIVILCIIVLIFSIPFSGPFSNGIGQSQMTYTRLPPELVLDQSQTFHSQKSNIRSVVWMAQSFKPLMSPLVKVDIKIEKMTNIEYPLEFSIRKNLTENELTYTQLAADNIPYYSNWIEIDFPDIEVDINETYYMVVRTNSPAGYSYSWYDIQGERNDYYARGEQWFSNDRGYSWEKTSTDRFDLDFTFRSYSYNSYTDLECEGFFNWTEVAPGDTVTGSFTVRNNGTPLSNLNWKIYNWPSWGTWTFSKSSGTRLKPEDGAITVTVSVEAPHSNIPDEYGGEVQLVNEQNPEDRAFISARMITPKSKRFDVSNYHYFTNSFREIHFFLWYILQFFHIN